MTSKLSESTLSLFSESGLTAAHAKKMCIQDVSTDELIKLFPDFAQKLRKFGVSAHEIPYFGLDGSRNGYSRYRLHDGEGLPKYLQIKDSKPHLYFPPFMEWTKIAAEPAIPIFLTEGERKAAKACVEGFPTIGLGGVWSWLGKS